MLVKNIYSEGESVYDYTVQVHICQFSKGLSQLLKVDQPLLEQKKGVQGHFGW